MWNNVIGKNMLLNDVSSLWFNYNDAFKFKAFVALHLTEFCTIRLLKLIAYESSKYILLVLQGFSLLCSSLQTSDPTHESQCREEARTRMADRRDVGISDARTQLWHTDSVGLLTATIHPQYGVYAPFAALRWYQSAGSRDMLTVSPHRIAW